MHRYQDSESTWSGKSIVKVLYVHVEVVKQLLIHTKVLKFRTAEIASAGF